MEPALGLSGGRCEECHQDGRDSVNGKALEPKGKPNLRLKNKTPWKHARAHPQREVLPQVGDGPARVEVLDSAPKAPAAGDEGGKSNRRPSAGWPPLGNQRVAAYLIGGGVVIPW